MLNDKEKKLVRYLIVKNPNAGYMADLASSDEFARAQIEAFKPELRATLQREQIQVLRLAASIAEKQDLLSE